MTDSDRILRIERRFRAPRELVFKAWTEVDRLLQWWGPNEVTTPVFEADVREGGSWAATMRGNDSGKEFYHSGSYLTVRPPDELAFTWAWIEDGVRGHETVVRVTFEQEGDQTVMHFEQKLFATDEQCRLHNEGWTSSLECLGQYLAELPASQRSPGPHLSSGPSPEGA